jgi:hypothetical protein
MPPKLPFQGGGPNGSEGWNPVPRGYITCNRTRSLAIDGKIEKSEVARSVL